MGNAFNLKVIPPKSLRSALAQELKTGLLVDSKHGSPELHYQVHPPCHVRLSGPADGGSRVHGWFPGSEDVMGSLRRGFRGMRKCFGKPTLLMGSLRITNIGKWLGITSIMIIIADNGIISIMIIDGFSIWISMIIFGFSVFLQSSILIHFNHATWLPPSGQGQDVERGTFNQRHSDLPGPGSHMEMATGMGNPPTTQNDPLSVETY